MVSWFGLVVWIPGIQVFCIRPKNNPLVNRGMQYATNPPQLEPPILKLASHNSFLVE